MRLIPQLLRPTPKLGRIAISQEEITADLRYPAPAPGPGRSRPHPQRRSTR
jgi:hypothetical protein